MFNPTYHFRVYQVSLFKDYSEVKAYLENASNRKIVGFSAARYDNVDQEGYITFAATTPWTTAMITAAEIVLWEIGSRYQAVKQYTGDAFLAPTA
ncbi:hypothetical protein I203_108014 [Kwoniella mangroviensis CBS 8507]|uniref:hypothetical protein n=1 Tax=Kwoniella mangroviensis CBS 8507 TaxID=1296122 RepID=UPI00080D6CBC|nr:uncharacterized protein I203_04908 [Kwoniella mangroviensis CBS 8507]OCF65888.1 hypothetical protein I203_04908 [Kwoniella mangroviensis CBS 8507]